MSLIPALVIKAIFWAIILLFLFVLAWGVVMLFRKILGREQNIKINNIWLIACILSFLLGIGILILTVVAVGALVNVG
ncbi:MAG: hypothetical protein WC473_00730 [Patescibacteria group bacterium]|jgi:uncharacterized membrane protein YiaA